MTTALIVIAAIVAFTLFPITAVVAHQLQKKSMEYYTERAIRKIRKHKEGRK